MFCWKRFHEFSSHLFDRGAAFSALGNALPFVYETQAKHAQPLLLLFCEVFCLHFATTVLMFKLLEYSKKCMEYES